MSFPRTTLVGAPVVAAPGKVFLVGEYAVLEEGSAVIAAVSREASAQYVPEMEAESPLVAEVVRRSIVALGELAAALPTGSVMVDSLGFQQDGQKLGLGSSAAAAVAAVGAVFECAGRSLADHRDVVYSIADAGHRAAQGGGSGGDIAAAVHGGFIHFSRPKDGIPAVVKLSPPAGLEVVVFWTGSSVSTAPMIGAVNAFAERTPPLYQWLMDEMRSIAARFVQEFSTGSARGVVEAADAYGDSLRELGASAGVPIVTPPFAAAKAVARTLGGTAKPSGAGGGDVGVALFADPDAARGFVARCPDGLSVLDVRVDAKGVHRRVAGGA